MRLLNYEEYRNMKLENNPYKDKILEGGNGLENFERNTRQAWIDYVSDGVMTFNCIVLDSKIVRDLKNTNVSVRYIMHLNPNTTVEYDD